MYYCMLTTLIFNFFTCTFSSLFDNSTLTTALFFIVLARVPKRRVDTVSASLNDDGEQLIIRVVFELPPSDSYRIRVSLESLYGMWVDLPSVKLLITIPSALSDLLIFLASSSVYPVAPVLPTFSLPARSVRYNRPLLIVPVAVSF